RIGAACGSTAEPAALVAGAADPLHPAARRDDRGADRSARPAARLRGRGMTVRRRVSTAPLLGIGLDRGAPEPLQRQIYDQIRAAILSGRLPPQSPLPSSRALAAELGVGRNTVTLAFEQLVSEGYLAGRIGSGTYVSPVLPDALLHARAGE